MKHNQDTACSNAILNSGPALIVFVIYDDEYFISDPQFDLQENTLEHPLEDGGGSINSETESLASSELVAECFNVSRTFVNQETCRLSSTSNACWSNGLLALTDVVCGSPG